MRSPPAAPADPADLEAVTPDGDAELADLLDGMHSDLRDLSGVITTTHLSPGGMQLLGVPTSAGWCVTHGPTGTAPAGATRSRTARCTATPMSSRARTAVAFTPRDSVRQRCLSHELVIEPGAADSSTSRDAYGNLSSYFHVTERHQTLTITSNSVVEVDPVPPELYGSGSALAPLGDRPAGRARRCACDGVRPGPTTPEITDEVRAYAAPSFVPGRLLVEVLADLNFRIYSEFTYRSGRRCPLGSARFWRRGRGMSGLRAARDRLPACQRAGRQLRFGIWSPTRPPGRSACSASTRPTPGYRCGRRRISGWFDPTNDQMVDERYIVVGFGRDYADVPPPGHHLHGSESSVIDVAVDVAPFEGEYCMRDFTCPNCGQHLAFENSVCLSCGSALGFSLNEMALLVIAPASDSDHGGAVDASRYQLCANLHLAECNWLVEVAPVLGGVRRVR